MTEQATLQKALYTIKKLKSLLQENQPKTQQPIAIIGMSSRFPEATGKEAYWQMLTEGRNVINKLSEQRWDLLKGTHEEEMRQSDHSYLGGYLNNIDMFDAYFFGISPREAQRIDPQHRILLEVAYEAFEDAGLPIEKLAGSNTGVFSSLYMSQLAHMQVMDNEMDALFFPTGNAISIAANRLSYLFDLHGPSIIVDSACSSSMVSLQLACLNLQNKNCDIAVVCGAKLNLLPYVNYVLTKAKMLSTDGQCKTFDADANGYVQGEGVGVVVLKHLDKAIQDADRIYGVIMGTAVNQDGKTNGLTAPNGLQQEALLKTAYQTANVNPPDISYVECHGTGTFLGDPIEIEALGEVVGKNRDANNPCWISSVKTNIGHLEPAAGIAGIIKVALALEHKKIPQHLNFSKPNPHIAFDKYHFRIPLTTQDWPKYGEYRMAGISSFGFGGTNSHVVIRELTAAEKPQLDSEFSTQTELFTLSAKDPGALALYIQKWCDYLDKNPGKNLAQICYNVHLKRSHYFCRIAILANSVQDLHNKLISLTKNPLPEQHSSESILINLKKDKITSANASLALTYINRGQIDWQKEEASRKYYYCDMPLYPWQSKKYWPPLVNNQKQGDAAAQNPYPLQGKYLSSPLNILQFEFVIDSKFMPDVEDTYNVVHAGYYLEIFAFAVKHLSGQTAFVIEDHAFLSPLFAQHDRYVTVHFAIEKIGDTTYQYNFYSRVQGQTNWVRHASGKLSISILVDKTINSLVDIKNRCKINETAENLYERVTAMGMPTGESIRWTKQYWCNNNEILCEFQQPDSTKAKNHLFTLGVHPGIFDGSIQPLFRLLPEDLVQPYIASGVKQVIFYGMKEGPYYLYGKLTAINDSGDKIVGDCFLINEHSEVIAEFVDMELAKLNDKVQIQKIMERKDKHVKIDLESLPIEQRKSYVTQFLVEQIALIFSMPEEDIQIDRSLRDLGIDSLMAIVLMRTLEVGLGISYSLHDLLQGPTIAELTHFVLGTTPTTPEAQSAEMVTKFVSKSTNPWIAHRKVRAEARTKLFCFPYGGGGASIYRNWQNEFPAEIEICPIQLPGREERLNEKPLENLNDLVDLLADNLQNEFNVPFAFFGHSIGSLIAFELARELQQSKLPTPTHLFVSAFPDPSVPTKSLNVLLEQLADIGIDLFALNTEAAVANLSDEKLRQLANIFSENGIVDYGDSLANKDIIKVLLPIFNGDMGIAKNYKFMKEPKLEIPITVFVGKKDSWVLPEDHLTWGNHTTRYCTIHEFDGGHLFIRDPEILQKLFARIQSVLIKHTQLVT